MKKKPVEKYKISVTRGCFIKYYLWRKIEVGKLYFSTNYRLTTPVKIETSSTYPSPSWHATLYPLFTVKVRLYHRVHPEKTSIWDYEKLSMVKYPFYFTNWQKRIKTNCMQSIEKKYLVAYVLKVRKRAKIRNRYNHAPHLTQDSNGKVTTSQSDPTN